MKIEHSHGEAWFSLIFFGELQSFFLLLFVFVNFFFLKQQNDEIFISNKNSFKLLFTFTPRHTILSIASWWAALHTLCVDHHHTDFKFRIVNGFFAVVFHAFIEDEKWKQFLEVSSSVIFFKQIKNSIDEELVSERERERDGKPLPLRLI